MRKIGLNETPTEEKWTLETGRKINLSGLLVSITGAALLALAGGLSGCARRVASAAAPAPIDVEVASVIQKDVPVQGES